MQSNVEYPPFKKLDRVRNREETTSTRSTDQSKKNTATWSQRSLADAVGLMSLHSMQQPPPKALLTGKIVAVHKVNMTISLEFLAPDLVRAAVEGRLARGMGATTRRPAVGMVPPAPSALPSRSLVSIPAGA
jgi:hypothetical protein